MLADPPVVSVRCVDGASLEETTVQNLYGCWRDFYLWVWQAYDLTDFTWDHAGISDACNVSQPFAKVVNAAFLINYALSDNYIPQWHSTEDYRNSSRASDNNFHGPFYCRLAFAGDSATTEANSQTGRFLAEDRINLYCYLFNLGSPANLPSERAAVMVHESWHHWQYKHGFVTAHPQCGSPAHDCDYYYFHGTGAFDFGQMDRYDTDPNHLLFHSPYQVAVEFHADLAEMSLPWVPLIVTQSARSIGNNRIDNRFVNAVGYRIGNPRPF
jgi:hypothetical protein